MTQASIAELVESWRPRNTDRYNLHPIVTYLKAHKGGPSKGKGKKTSLASPGFHEPLSPGGNTLLELFLRVRHLSRGRQKFDLAHHPHRYLCAHFGYFDLT